MKFKQLAIILALFGFSTYLFAEPVKYSFSSFGGGLPSSAARVSLAANDDNTQQRIIIEDDDEDDYDYDYDYSDEPTVKKGKQTGLIITYVVVGVVAVAGIAIGAYYLTNESANCCATTLDNMAQGCGEECGKECGSACNQSMDDACSSSMNNACSSSSSQGCSSSSSSSSCSTTSISGLLANGIQIIPVYVP